MKKTILSLAALVAVTSLSADTDGVNTKLKHGKHAKKETPQAKSVDDLSSMFTEGKTSGQFRTFYVDRQYQGGSGSTTHRNDLAVGGHLKFETAAFAGLSLASSFYTSNSIKWLAYDVQDPSLTNNGENYSVLGEAYVNINLASYGTKTNAKLGYQRYDTPMMGSDDARMTPNTFSAYKLTNTDVDGLKFQLAHIDAIAYGSFSNIYSGGILGATSGYPALAKPGSGKYHNLGQITVGKDTAGVTNAQLTYTAKHFHVKVSNDYAWDMYNTLYAELGTSWDCLLNSNIHPFVKAQVIKQNSVGDKLMGNIAGTGKIDSLYWGAKVGAKYAGFAAYVAYSQTGANDANSDSSYENAIVSQFGGMPAYTQGMVTRHQFLAGTKATKYAAVYNFKSLGVNLSTAAYYATFDMDANSGYGVERTASEPGFDIKYYPASVKKLQLRFRGNFPRKFVEGTAGSDTGWDEYRLIANYNF